MATGKNLTFKADTARRVTLCQLDCRHETPEDRDDFQHSNIEAHTLENRHRLAVAALTILRASVKLPVAENADTRPVRSDDKSDGFIDAAG